MSCYNELAQYYDMLMDDIDYEMWVSYIAEIINKHNTNAKFILDAACGTGNVTIPMAKKGYKIIGVDFSQEMLSIAENKAWQQKQKIQFLNQDMADLKINQKFDVVLCMCDGVNYIVDEEELKKFFTSTYNLLLENGIFIFDISSYNKLSKTLGNNVLYYEKNNIHYIWDNNFDDVDQTVEMNLIFFVPDGNSYNKFEEYHMQKAYKCNYLKELLNDSGFQNIKTYDEFNFKQPSNESDRIFFVAYK